VTDSAANDGGGSVPTSLSLLERARARDPQAWGRLVRLYAPLIYRWCRWRGLRDEAAEDVGQEVFQRVFRNLMDFRKESADHTFRGWLRVITERCVSDYRSRHPPATAAQGGSDAQRALAQVPDVDSVDSPPPAPEGAERDERRILLRQALRQIEQEFTEPTWRAFWRVVVDGQSSARVAEELGITANAVYLAKGRVLRRFREEFQGLIEEP
jgi:RNA polymerase sigma-70 factor (ECF subfamily)